jgi:hypothetical protein
MNSPYLGILCRGKMFEKTTIGEWMVIGLSVIIALIVSLSRTFDSSSFGVFILSLIVLYIIYWVITKIHPNSQNWGIIIWGIALVGIPLIIIFVLAVAAAFIFGLAGSGSNYQWEKYSNYGIAFSHPSSIPINTSFAGYPNATYYKGDLLFDNPIHQQIAVVWFPEGNALSQVTQQQKYFSLFKSGFQKVGVADFTESSIQETTHSGQTVYYVTGNGHYSGYNLNLGYYVISIWEDPPSQRDFVIMTISYKSQEDAQSLFEGVLNSFEGH